MPWLWRERWAFLRMLRDPLKTVLPVSSSSRSQQMVVQTNAGIFEDDRGSLEVFSSVDSALHDDECETVKGLSDDGHSYAGTVVRAALRGDGE